MRKRTRPLSPILWSLCLAVMAAAVVFMTDLFLFTQGVGGFAEVVETLAGKESIDQVTEREYFDVILPAGEGYLAFELFVLGPAVLVLVTLVYVWRVDEQRWWHYALMAFPTALLLSWLMLDRFVLAMVLYAALVALVAKIGTMKQQQRRRQS